MISEDQKYILELMLRETSRKKTFDYIHNKKSLLTKFQQGGFKLSKTDNLHIKRRIKTIIDNTKDNEYTNLFMLWYDDENRYEEILKPYFDSKEYLNSLKEKDIDDNYYYIFNNNIFDQLLNVFKNKNHILFFQYFSPIKFTNEQKSILKKNYFEHCQLLKEKQYDESESEEINNNIKYEKENEKLHKEILKLKNQIAQLNQNYKDEKKINKNLKGKINKIKNLEEEISLIKENLDSITTINQNLETENNELKKEYDNLSYVLKIERKQAYESFLTEKKQEIENKINMFNQENQKKVDNLKEEIEELITIKKTLINFHEQKRTELEKYIINGEKWKNAFRPKKTTSLIINEELENIFKTINIEKKMKQSKSRFIIFDRNFLDTFKNNVFILYADSADITVDKFYRKKGYFKSYPQAYDFLEFLKIVKNFSNCCFACVIYNSNRAPIECYFNNIINAIENHTSLVVEDELIDIPENIIFLFQLDDDEYSAKLSKFLSNLLIKLPDGVNYETN